MSEESIPVVIESSKEGTGSSFSEPCSRLFENWSSCCEVKGRFEQTTPMQQLEAFLEGYWYSLSQRPLDDQQKHFSLEFDNVVITRRMITLLHPLLHCGEVSSSVHHGNNSDNMETLPYTTRNTRSVFSKTDISNRCRFFSPADATTPDHDDDVCTPDDKVCFLSALARCSKRIDIRQCPEFVSALLDIPEIDQLEARCVEIYQDAPLTDLECIRLGAILANSVKVHSLDLAVPLANVPQAFCDSFANYIHIQSLSLANFCSPTTGDQTQPYTFWSKMIPNDRNGPLERLLRNPQNQLKELFLDKTNLEDHPFMVLAQLLPISHIKTIFLMENNIQAPGLLEFARQLPNVHFLVFIFLEDNPWENSSLEVLETCGAALLHGLIENPSIQDLKPLNLFPQRPLLEHYLSLNRAGRKLLTSSSSYGKQPSIPDGLWPRVLSLAGRRGGRSFIPINKGRKYTYNGEANAVYYFLRNCPAIFSRQEKSTGIGYAGVRGTL